jgi:hypothetical protein
MKILFFKMQLSRLFDFKIYNKYSFSRLVFIVEKIILYLTLFLRVV